MPAHFDEQRKIFRVDYRGLKGDALLAEIEKTHNEARKAFFGIKANVLVDVRGAVLDTNAVNALKESNKRDKHMIGKTAVIGITGLKRILADGIALFSGNVSKNFDTEQQAIHWLMEK